MKEMNLDILIVNVSISNEVNLFNENYVGSTEQLS